ncbi:hypothetical protein ACFXO7_33735, partial [Nocardia tengchongensis]|uniref:hypothetical protein n=1 Tax=Nocardia tengchongensis TaxID=2055889 RepID=UPI0036C5295D
DASPASALSLPICSKDTAENCLATSDFGNILEAAENARAVRKNTGHTGDCHTPMVMKWRPS